MGTNIYETRKNNYLISTDPVKLQPDMIYAFLARAYWSQGRPTTVIDRSIKNSLCFGLYDGDQQIGFSRVVTDYATYAWLCDVFIHEDHRGRGLGKWLLACILAHPDLQYLKRWALATSDAHGLYRQFGFTELMNPEKHMELLNLHVYDQDRLS